jgi:hAT family C-terminal dimerisation region
LYNDTFFQEVQQEIEKLEPFCKYIDLVQARDCSLATAIEEWLKLPTVLGWEEKKMLRDRMILTKAGLKANLLHPQYRGKSLDGSLKSQSILAFLIHLKQTTEYSKLHEFLDGSGPFFGKPELQDLENNPMLYWKTCYSYSPKLSELALSFLSLPSSTASLERVFSMWSFVHDKSRNRLSTDKSEKLIYIYHCLKNIDKQFKEY